MVTKLKTSLTQLLFRDLNIISHPRSPGILDCLFRCCRESMAVECVTAKTISKAHKDFIFQVPQRLQWPQLLMQSLMILLASAINFLLFDSAQLRSVSGISKRHFGFLCFRLYCAIVRHYFLLVANNKTMNFSGSWRSREFFLGKILGRKIR